MQEFGKEDFVLLGVNSDPQDVLKKLIDEGTVTWPCIWDGGSAQGPIAGAWGVHGWPTFFLIDREGKIRFHGHQSNLEDMIRRLLSK